MNQIVDSGSETVFPNNVEEIELVLNSSGTDIPTLSTENDTSFLIPSVISTMSQMPSSVFPVFPTSSPFGSTTVPTSPSNDTAVHSSSPRFDISPKSQSFITGRLSLCLTISADNIEVSSYQFHNHRPFPRNSPIHSVCSLYISISFLSMF